MANTKGSRVTLVDVAQRSGVSLSTVSKVLNGRSDVAQSTRDLVEQAFSDLGYISRTDNRTGQTRRTVLVVLANGVNAYAAQVLEGIMSEAVTRNVEIVLTRVAASGQIDPGALVKDIAADGHLGVVFVNPDFDDEDAAFLTRRRVPMAMVDPVNPIHDEGVSIGSTNWSGGFTITKYLTDAGHRRIGFVGGPKRSLVNQARLSGYQAGLEQAHIGFDETLVTFGLFRYTTGYQQGLRLLKLPQRPSAIVAASDLSALGVMAAARELGLDLPADLSVTGYDDTWTAEWSVPALTTIRQPMQAMGSTALRVVVDEAEGTSPSSKRLELNTELVVRQSVVPFAD